jgi:2-amino-4-hydroxy-6-hydroxymethyldihydropteridine diphosphokinase
MAIAYLGLGANLGDPSRTIVEALIRLSGAPGVDIEGVSPLYVTKPIGGPPGQPNYVNAAARINCDLEPSQLLRVCLSVEEGLGRLRGERWGPRTIDIDVLLYDHQIIDQPGLVVPHPLLRERLFALVPLSDVAPKDFTLPPDGKLLTEILTFATNDDAMSDQKPLLFEDQDVVTVLTGHENSKNKKI